MESIIKKEKACYFCGSEQNLERHHALYGRANRRLAEQDNLWVWCCSECHRGDDGVHANPNRGKDLTLKMAAEYAWIKQRNLGEEEGIESFRRRYGINFL